MRRHYALLLAAFAVSGCAGGPSTGQLVAGCVSGVIDGLLNPPMRPDEVKAESFCKDSEFDYIDCIHVDKTPGDELLPPSVTSTPIQ